MKTIDLVISIGTGNTAVYQRGRGLVIKEPSAVIITNRGGKMTLVESGRAAVQEAAKLDAKEQLLYPIKDGAIFHERAAVLMYKEFIGRLLPYSPFKPKVRVIACISCGLTAVGRRDVENVLIRAGAGEVILLESPLAAAEFLGIDHAVIVDIGAGKTEIAVTSPSGIISGCSLDIGGDAINRAIMDYVTDVFRQKIKFTTAEKIKKSILSLSPADNASCVVSGRSIQADSASSIKLETRGVRQAVLPLIDKIAEAIVAVCSQMPTNIYEDVAASGLHLCGGSANIPGIDRYLAEKLEWEAYVINEPDNACVIGAAHFFENPGKLGRLLNLQNLR